MAMVCQLLVQICLEWNYSLHKGQWYILLQIWLWLVNNGVLWNMVFPKWPRKESKNQLSWNIVTILAVTNMFKMTKTPCLAVAKLTWSTVCRLAFKMKTNVLCLHYFNYCRVLQVYVFVTNVEICKRSQLYTNFNKYINWLCG
jgi:hypothetical protein